MGDGEAARKSQREWAQISRRRRLQERKLASAGSELQLEAASETARVDPIWAGARVVRGPAAARADREDGVPEFA